MRTPRLLLLFLVLGVVVLLALQNISPALPLVFLGLRTPAYPLAFWLVGAIALGALTSLFLVSLVTPGGLAAMAGRRMPNRSGRRIPYPPEAPSRSANPRSRPPTDPAASGEWGEWTNLKSPSQWENWEQADQSTASEPPPNQPRWGRKRQEEQVQRVNESWQELADGWEDLEDVRYRPRGVSPVADALDDLEEGWEDDRRQPDFDSNQSPRRVYQDGSIYAYSYQEPDGSEPGRTDDVYDSEDDDWVDSGEEDEEEDLENVVDADYRVIVPPYRPLDPQADQDTDEDWVDPPPKK